MKPGTSFTYYKNKFYKNSAKICLANNGPANIPE